MYLDEDTKNLYSLSST